MAQDTRVGSTIGSYRIESLIARGGMSAVYLAEDVRLHRKVALKIRDPTLGTDPRFRERFVKESEMAAGMEHPNIVPIYEAGEQDGVLFIAMRYLPGSDLATVIRDQSPLHPDRVLSILAQVADALDDAHSHGLIHRDVKPGNVLLDRRQSIEHAYLTDFGITKHTESASGLTGTGMFVGTLDYIAPEQIEGKRVDGRADIYSLGCMLFECLTGQPPFKRDEEVAIMFAHMNDPPPSVRTYRPELPAEVDAVLARAMAKRPDERFPTAAELIASARSAIRGRPAGAGQTLVGVPTTIAPASVGLAGSLGGPASVASTGVGGFGGSAPPPPMPSPPSAPFPVAPQAPPVGQPPSIPPGGQGWLPFPPPSPPREPLWKRRAALFGGGGVLAVVLIVVLVLALGGGGKKGGGGGPSTPPPGPAGVAAPAGLSAAAQSGGEVDLTWTVASGVSYRIYRDGQLLGTATASPYRDYGVDPSASYSYTVQAVKGSALSAQSQAVKVNTPAPPPLSTARLDGTFAVTLRVTQTNGFTNEKVGDTYDQTWTFAAQCETGPCDVNLDPDLKGVTPGVIQRQGGQYRGTLQAPTRFTCGSTDVPGTFAFTVKVTGAHFDHGVWQATGITGSLGEDSPAGAGCGEATKQLEIASSTVQ